MTEATRIKRIEIQARYLTALLREQSPLRTCIIHGLPDDARIVGFALEPERAFVLTVYVWSKEFPLLDEGAIVPLLDIVDHSIYWPQRITDQMEAWLKEEGIAYRPLPEIVLGEM